MILRIGSKNGEREVNRQWQAFTLLELILVMAILLIVVGAAAPALSSFFRGRVLDSEGRRFVALTRHAQERAVAEGIPMVLWIDKAQRAYGLRQEMGYSEQDTKAVQLLMDRDITIEVTDVPQVIGALNQARQTQLLTPNLPMLRFQPDGFVDETSPQTVVLRQAAGDRLWITKSRSQMNYEVQTNSMRNAFR
ncbi:MAG TPA: GspH/FimT family pseudopilin [Verrucomicrobiae bacterium]|jgi:type II secretion system protein H